MKTIIFGAGSDLGVNIDGAFLGPQQLINDINTFYKGEKMIFAQDTSIIKSRNLSDRRKNEYEIENFNTNLYKNIVEKLKEEYFPIVIGGDSSVSIASSFAEAKANTDVGLIWIDSNPSYNTFETTQTGNIHDLSLAAITGYKCNELKYYHDGKIIQPSHTVIIGARGMTEQEEDNIRYSGTNLYTTKDIKEQGIENIINEAFRIASYKTKGIHIVFSLGILDPEIAPGVSSPVYEGLSEDETMKINENIIKHMKDVLSYDLVEFNPLRDIERKTEQIALNLLTQIIKAAEKKQKIEQVTYY